MLNLIVILLAGSSLVYISKYNWVGVPLDLGFYQIANIPLFYVIAGALILGLVFSYIMQLLQSLANSWVLRGKNKVIKEGTEEVLQLTKRVHQVELENEKLKHGVNEPSDARAL